MDELFQIWNILKGEMSFIGPRPIILTLDEQINKRVEDGTIRLRPGLSGLAQVKGRNAISWEEKLDWDLKYIERITFWGDLKLVFATVISAFIKAEGISDGENATVLDYGDWLLKANKISKNDYFGKIEKAKNILKELE